jgi:hypothetical protein
MSSHKTCSTAEVARRACSCAGIKVPPQTIEGHSNGEWNSMYQKAYYDAKKRNLDPKAIPDSDAWEIAQAMRPYMLRRSYADRHADLMLARLQSEASSIYALYSNKLAEDEPLGEFESDFPKVKAIRLKRYDVDEAVRNKKTDAMFERMCEGNSEPLTGFDEKSYRRDVVRSLLLDIFLTANSETLSGIEADGFDQEDIGSVADELNGAYSEEYAGIESKLMDLNAYTSEPNH